MSGAAGPGDPQGQPEAPDQDGSGRAPRSGATRPRRNVEERTRTVAVIDPWQALRRFTAARIALGRAGISLPTARHLEFQFAHARARDAVHAPLDADALENDLRGLGVGVMRLHSAAADRLAYLQRPDLGRRLDSPSRQRLADAQGAKANSPFDVAFVVADGLSAQAVARHATPLLARLLPGLVGQGRAVAPVSIVLQGRVAIGDEVGELLRARLVVVLIGERPGLSSPDSLGVYMTWAPRIGRTDAERNCISNVRPEGLPFEQAAAKLSWLMEQAEARALSGVGLKDETDAAGAALAPASNFLLPGQASARAAR